MEIPATANRNAPVAPRVLLITGAGTVIPFILRDFTEALQATGAETFSIMPLQSEVTDAGYTAEGKTRMRDTARAFKPDFILTMDAGGFRQDPALFAEIGVPVAAWFVDNPLYFIGPTHMIPNLAIFCWDRAYLEALARLGCDKTAYLPLATNPKQFHPGPLDAADLALYGCDVSFVGDSVTDSAWRNVSHTAPDPRAAQILEDVAAALARDEGQDTAALLEECERRAAYTLPPAANRTLLCLLLEEEATGRRRRALVSALAPLKPHIHGDDGWKTTLPDGPVFRGKADYHGELAKIYIASAVNVNISKAQLRTSVNQRVFDAPACGAFVLTDYRRDLEDLFDPETEIAVFRGAEELVAQAEHFLNDPEARNRIAAAACRRVMTHHTWRHRAETMLRRMAAWR